MTTDEHRALDDAIDALEWGRARRVTVGEESFGFRDLPELYLRRRAAEFQVIIEMPRTRPEDVPVLRRVRARLVRLIAQRRRRGVLRLDRGGDEK